MLYPLSYEGDAAQPTCRARPLNDGDGAPRPHTMTSGTRNGRTEKAQRAVRAQ